MSPRVIRRDERCVRSGLVVDLGGLEIVSPPFASSVSSSPRTEGERLPGWALPHCATISRTASSSSPPWRASGFSKNGSPCCRMKRSSTSGRPPESRKMIRSRSSGQTIRARRKSSTPLESRHPAIANDDIETFAGRETLERANGGQANVDVHARASQPSRMRGGDGWVVVHEEHRRRPPFVRNCARGRRLEAAAPISRVREDRRRRGRLLGEVEREDTTFAR